MNRTVLLGTMGAAVIGAALVLNYAINREETAPPPPSAVTEPAAVPGESDGAAVPQAVPAPPAGADAPAPAATPPPGPTAPQFDIVRVDPQGGTVIAGRAAPGSEVTVLLNGEPAASVRADSRGEWVVIPDRPLPPGSHEIGLSATLAGKPPVTSEEMVVVVVPEPNKDIAGRETGRTGQALAVLVPRQGEGGTTVLQVPPVTAEAVDPAAAAGEPASPPALLSVAGAMAEASVPLPSSAPAGTPVADAAAVEAARMAAASTDPAGVAPPPAPAGAEPPESFIGTPVAGTPAPAVESGAPGALAAGSVSTGDGTGGAAAAPVPYPSPSATAGVGSVTAPLSGDAVRQDTSRPAGFAGLVNPDPNAATAASGPGTISAPATGGQAAAPAPDAGGATDGEVPSTVPERVVAEDSAAPLPGTPLAAAAAALAATHAVGEGVASGALVLDSVDYDEGGNVVIGGRAEPGSILHVYLDNALIGTAVAQSGGRWHVRPGDPVSEGLHTLRVDQVAQTGQVVARVESPFSRAEPVNALPGQAVVVVQPGNSLWRIARRTYGEGLRYSVIYQANRSQIADPDLIYPGQVFVVPKIMQN